MKILFITRKYPPSTGGMELFAYDLSQALAAKADLRLVKWGGSGRLLAVLIALPYVSIKAFFALLRGGVDIIHIQDGLLAPTGYVLSRLFRKPYTVVIHGLDITYGNRLFRTLIPPAVRRAGAVFCISQAAADEVVKRGISESKVLVVPLAVQEPLQAGDSKLLDLPAEGPVLITVGRLVKRKGVAWFIEKGLPDLVKEYPSLTYLVVGDGEERPAIEAAIKEAGLVDHVRLLGRVSDEAREAAYASAGIFVMPNIPVPGDLEGFGLVLLEASVRGLPVVASDTEGIKEAVTDGQNGVLVPPGDAPAFKREIEKFLSDRDYAKKFGSQSRQFTLTNYRWESLAERYIERYKRLIGR